MAGGMSLCFQTGSAVGVSSRRGAALSKRRDEMAGAKSAAPMPKRAVHVNMMSPILAAVIPATVEPAARKAPIALMSVFFALITAVVSLLVRKNKLFAAAQMERLQTYADEMAAERKDLIALVEAKQKEVSQMGDDLGRLESQMSVAVTEGKVSGGAVATLEGDIMAYKASLAQVSKETDEALVSLQTVQRDVKTRKVDMEKELAPLQAQLSQNQLDAAELNNRLATARGLRTDLKMQAEALEMEVLKLETDLSERKASLQERVEQVAKDVGDLMAQEASESQAMEEYKEQIEDLSKRKEEILDQLVDNGSIVPEFKDYIDELTAAREKLEKTKEESGAVKEELAAEVAKVQNELEAKWVTYENKIRALKRKFLGEAQAMRQLREDLMGIQREGSSSFLDWEL